MPYPLRPHVAFPFSRSNGKVNVVEQGSEQHIMSCVQTIAYCPTGFRLERPEFGWNWPDLTVATRIDPAPLLQAIKNFEPRVASLDTEVDPHALANAAVGVDNITVRVGISTADQTGVNEEVD